MSVLEIRRLDGGVERRELSKRQPLSIGRHQASDVRLDEEGVDLIHCRIAWSKDAYEVTAANKEGVEVNGTLVQHAPLKPGDTLRVGSADISVHSGETPAEVEQPSEEIPLQPISEEEVPGYGSPASAPERKGSEGESEDAAGNMAPAVSREAASSEAPESGSGTDSPENRVLEGIDSDGLEEAAAESGGDEESNETGDRETFPRGAGRIRLAQAAKRREEQDKRLFARRPARPGEQDILRSPFVLGLGGGVLLLLLVAATFWFIIGRQAADQQYDAALAAMNEGRYATAVDRLEDFLNRYPHSQYARSARIELDKSLILQEISGSDPDWPAGLAALEAFIDRHRDDAAFNDHKPDLREYARRITLQAAGTAENSNAPVERRQKLVDVSETAEQLLERYSGPDGLPGGLQDRIRRAQRRAQAAVLRQDVFDEAIAEMESLLEAEPPEPVAVLAARSRLIERYAGFADDRKLNEFLERALRAERELVERTDMDGAALSEQRPARVPPPLTLTPHARARSDEVSQDRALFVVAKDCCYGVDTVTGEPVWRRVIGLETPFFPVPVATSVPGVLLFDTTQQELVFLEQATGALIWRQPLGETAAGPPLVHESQIYLPTRQNHLYRFDAETGRMTARLTLPHKLLAPPVLLPDGEHLALAGEKGVVYTLSLRPLACRVVSHTGHEAGAVEAPLLPMGRLLLMAENDRLESCLLRVFEAADGGQRLAEAASVRIDGQVRDRPLLRGRRLIVPTDRQRVVAFTVSDAQNEKPLTRVAAYPLDESYTGPMHLAAAPEGRFWVAGNALHSLRIATDSIKRAANPVASGISSQPLQELGRYLYVARHPLHSRAVLFTRSDKETMTSTWGTVLGAAVLEWTGTDDGPLVCVTETGHVFRVGIEQLAAGGFQHDPAERLELPETAAEPLRARRLTSRRIAVHSGDPEPRLWIVGPDGAVERETALAAPLQADPVELPIGTVLPLPGKLAIARSADDSSGVEPYAAPVQGGEPVRWKHLVALDQDHLLTVDSRNTLTRIQYRDSPIPALAPVSTLRWDQPIDRRPCRHEGRLEGRLIVADASGRVNVLDAANLEPVTEVQLDAPPTWGPAVVDDRLYLETGRDRLHCFALQSGMTKQWDLSLDGDGLAGEPVAFNGRLMVGLQNGDVLAVEPDDGNVQQRFPLGQPIQPAPKTVGNVLVVPAIDGSLYRLNSLPGENE